MLKDYADAKADLAKAKPDLEWIVAEWRHVWPLAPEEILGGANPRHDCANAERDIAGNFMMRDRSTLTVLTVRLNKKQRREGGESCFSVETTDKLAERLAFHRSRIPVGRSGSSLARARADRADHVKRLREKLALAKAYEAETARIRAASGVEAAKQRVTKGHAPVYLIAEKIAKYPVATPEGLSAKADFLLTCDEMAHVGYLFGKGNLGMVGFGWGLAEDIRRLRGNGVVLS